MGQLVHLVFAQGERYPMLVDLEGVPDFWVTIYTTIILRVSLKQTAIENTLRNLQHLKLWEEINERDLISEFSQSKFLSEADIFSIRDHCLLNTRALRKWSQIKFNKNVAKLSLAHPASIRQMQRVSKNHASNRLVNIANFLHFTARALLRLRSNFVSLSTTIDQMRSKIIAQKPRGIGGHGLASDPDSKAPPPEVFETLMRVVKIDSPNNPFKNSGIRIRNALMFEVLYETGMRSGEILALQIGDIDFNDDKISIVRRHDNPHDTRKRQPVAKTLERDIPIPLALKKRLRDYVMSVRSKVVNIKSPPFLFVTHKRGKYQGQPLSESSFKNRVLGPVTKSNQELFEEVSRHGFRHNFNHRLSQKIDAINLRAKTDSNVMHINEKMQIQIRKQLNGWSSDGSAETYNLRYVREISNNLMREDMDALSKFLKKEKK